MNIQRRRATNKEIEQGQREMKLAEERMKKEAETRGEMPIEDVKAEGSQEGSGVVSAPPIADETKVDSEGNPTSNGPPGATSGPETAGPMTPPPTDPPRMSPQEFASPGLRTPAGTTKGKEKQEGTSSSATKEAVGSREVPVTDVKREEASVRSQGGGLGVPSGAEVSMSAAPLFTPEQFQQMAALQNQASWLYAPPQSVFTPFASRPAFLNQEENRFARESTERDRWLEELREQQLRDQREREELRMLVNQISKENVALKATIQSLRMSTEGGEPKFSTPEDDVGQAQEAANSKNGAGIEVPAQKEAVDPQKEAADPLGSPKEEEVLPWRTKEAADPPPKTSKEESHHRGADAGQADTGPGSQFTQKSLEFMSLMVESMKEMQKKVSEQRDEGGSIRGVEVVRSGVLDLPGLPPCNPSQGPLQLGDWLLMVEPIAADMTSTSEEWWTTMVKAVESWYQRHMSLSPLDRITHDATPPASLQQERWQRLERRMSTMLLHSVPENVREELVAGRKMSVFSILAHLFLTYCPGGVLEKQMLLRSLEDPPEVTSIGDAPAALRRWMRWKARTAEIGAVIPDAALLLKGLNRLTKRVLDGHRDLQFRIQLARSSLGVDTTPTELSVTRFATHLLAEIEQVALTEKRTGGQTSKQDVPKLKAMEVEKPEKGKGKGQERSAEDGGGKPRCRFFFSDGGCKKGKLCGFSHEGRDDKRRCWVCGSVDHFAPACTRPKGSSENSPPKARALKSEAEQGGNQKESDAPTAPSSESAIKDLMEEANKMLKSLTASSSSQATTVSSSASSVEESKQETMDRLQKQLNALRMKVLKIQKISSGHCQGLIDSGATHALRPKKLGEDISQYKKVEVSLADGQTALLAINAGGTMVSEEADIEPIVPMSALMKDLGCEAVWKAGELSIIHPGLGSLPVQQAEGCPQISKQLALQLIEEIERKKLKIGEKAEDFSREAEWMRKLVAEHPLLKSLPGWIREGLLCEVGEWNQLPANRRARKRMQRDGFILHLFAGPNEGCTLQRAWQQAGGQEWQLLEMDVVRGEDQDLLKPKVYGGLMRAALEGRIKAVVGGPNCRTRSVLRHYPIEGNPQAPRPVRNWGGGEFGSKHLTHQERQQVIEDDLLLWRMIFIYMVATFAARARGELQDPLFSLEQPASPKQYMPEVVSFWDTEEWRRLKEEFSFTEETFEQGKLGGKSAKPTTFGGSLQLNVEDYKITSKRHPSRVNSSKELARWPPMLMMMLADELIKQVYQVTPKLKPMSWQEHLAFGHIPYRRDCKICQETLQQCAPHRKSKHVIGGVLSLDTAGPLIGAYDQGGGMARYFLAGALTWRVPKGTNRLQQPPTQPLEGDEPRIEDRRRS